MQESNSNNGLSSTFSLNKAVRYLAHMQNLESEEIDQEIKRFKQHANPITPEISNILFSSMFTQFENRMLMVGAAAAEEAKKLNKSLWISGFMVVLSKVLAQMLMLTELIQGELLLGPTSI